MSGFGRLLRRVLTGEDRGDGTSGDGGVLDVFAPETPPKSQRDDPARFAVAFVLARVDDDPARETLVGLAPDAASAERIVARFDDDRVRCRVVVTPVIGAEEPLTIGRTVFLLEATAPISWREERYGVDWRVPQVFGVYAERTIPDDIVNGRRMLQANVMGRAPVAGYTVVTIPVGWVLPKRELPPLD